ncbi:MAG: uroporphyrinogen-III C-methyltransferase [Pseudomonadota bacterium]
MSGERHGKVYLVGAGPGAPDLLTLRAAGILRRADVVFHDALVHPEVVALAHRAHKVPVGKRCSQVSTDQRFINRSLVEAARRHSVVVRLKGGDPMVFGRAQEEIDALQAAGIEFEVVPGVTAALGASADLGVSLTERGVSRSVVMVTPRVGKGERDSRWAEAVAAADTAVIYMGAGEAAAIAGHLIAKGVSLSTPVVVVENASLPEGRRLPMMLWELPRVAEQGITGPAVIFVGEVFRRACQDEACSFEAYGSAWFR